MKLETVLKDNQVLRVSLDKSRGYVIRFKECSGVVLCIEPSNPNAIVVSGNASNVLSLPELQAAVLEAQEGIAFMNSPRWAEFLKSASPKSISKKNLIRGAYYEDASGKGVLYIGTGSLRFAQDSRIHNRMSCDYICAKVYNYQDIEIMGVTDGVLNVAYRDSGYLQNVFDTYCNAPNNLVRCLWQPDKAYNRIHNVNNSEPDILIS